MKTYRIGRLIKNDSSDTSSFKLVFSMGAGIYPNTLDRKSLKLNVTDFEYLKGELNYWADKYCKIDDEKLLNILKRLSDCFTKNVNNSVTIIYELVEDVDGKIYGKELLTNLIFPIRSNEITEYYYNYDNDRSLDKKVTYSDENIDRFKYIITRDDVASMNIVNEYLNKKNNPKEYKKYIDSIKYIYNENVFNKELIFKEIQPLEKQNELTKLMEDIEYLLSILKNMNIKLYNKYNEDYKKLCNPNFNNLNYCEPSKQELSNLLSSIKLSLIINENECNNIIDYLNIIIEECLNNQASNNLEIKDIDNLNDMFLKSKDDYDIQIQRTVLKKISLLYLLLVKKYIDANHNINLDNSYFKDNTKSILLNIIALNELGIIHVDINVESLKNTTTLNVLDIIKRIKFNNIKNEQIKQLIK